MKRSPLWVGDGVPRCSHDDCPQYDGKRCGELGFQPSNICEPAVRDMADELVQLRRDHVVAAAPIPMRIICPGCDELHIDEGEFATKPHHTHACQECGEVFRPAIVPTVGVRFLPGFRSGGK